MQVLVGPRTAGLGVQNGALGSPPVRPYPDPVGFVEREGELAVLRSATAQAKNGEGSGIAVIDMRALGTPTDRGLR